MVAIKTKCEKACERDAASTRLSLRELHLDPELTPTYSDLRCAMSAVIRGGAPNDPRLDEGAARGRSEGKNGSAHASPASLYGITSRLPREVVQITLPLGRRNLKPCNVPLTVASSGGCVSVSEIRATGMRFPAVLACMRTRSDTDAHAS
jgi:hypothetical protein